MNKILRNNFKQRVEDLYTKNYETVMKEIEDINKTERNPMFVE